MAPLDLIEQILSASDSEARSLIAHHRSDHNFGAHYWNATAQRFGSDPDSAKRLASYWRTLGSINGSRFDSLRVRSLRERANGQWLASASALEKAALEAPDELAKWTCKIGAIDALGRCGRVESATKLAESICRALDRLGDKISAGRACINAGNACNWHDDYSRAAQWFNRALAYLKGTENLVAIASAHLGLSTCFLFSSTPKECSDAASSAKEIFERLGLPAYAALAQINIAHALLRQGQADEARSLLLKIREAPLSPVDSARVEEFLGDAYIRLNLYEEAIDAFETALGTKEILTLPMNRANCELGQGEALYALGQFSRALPHFRAAAKIYGRFGNELWQAVARLRILLCAKSPSQSKALLLAHHFQRAKCRQYQVEALLVAAAKPGEEGAKALRQAKGLIRRFAMTPFAWRAEWVLSHRSFGPQRLAAYRRMASAILEAREFVFSRSGGLAFFRDKDKAISEYLELLLHSGNKAKVAEALEFLMRSRSLALTQEAATATLALSDEIRNKIELIRTAISSSLDDDMPGGSARRTLQWDTPAISLRRKWHELDHERLATLEQQSTLQKDTLVFVRGSHRDFGILGGIAVPLKSSPSETDRAMRWLRFELLEAMLEPGANPCRVWKLVDELKATLWDPFRNMPFSSLCPEGQLWGAPWQLFAHRDGRNEEILLTPSLSPPVALPGEFARNRAIWYFPSPDLPHISREGEAFVRRFSEASVCTSVTQAREQLAGGKFGLLHIACHAFLHRTSPSFSALCGQDGRLFAGEIARSRLRARHVILSACDSGAVAGTANTEIDGLARAFLSQGAEFVLATQWPLHDESAEYFMNLVYNELGSGADLPSSVAVARRQTMGEFPHPYNWAGPVLYKGSTQ